MAPMAIFVFTVGRKNALSKYAVISALGVAAVILGGNWLVVSPWSYLCLLGAICIHISVFFSAFLIQEEKFIRVVAAQSVQPMLFAFAVTLELVHLIPTYDWSYVYFFSGAVSLGVYLLVANHSKIKQTLTVAPAGSIKWTSIVLRIACCVSFPIFFQLELVLCGRFSSADVGIYSMVQKLYASIPIALSGSIAVHWLAKHMKSGIQAKICLDFESLQLAVICSLCVPLIGFSVLLLARGGRGLTPELILLSAGTAFLFTSSTLANLRLIALRPLIGFRVFGISLAVYILLFTICRPKTNVGFLILAATFFAAFLLLSLFEDRSQIRNKIANRIRPALIAPGLVGAHGDNQ